MDRLAQFPTSLRAASTLLRLGPAPALVCLPEGEARVPALLWLHGRTVAKEIDSARYLRLIRAGIAVVALDLPGHGERLESAMQEPEAMPGLLAQAIGEIDPVLEALRGSPATARIDLERMAMGGMSAGGMVTLRRLCDPHPFRAVSVESTAGDFSAAGEGRWEEARTRGLEPRAHLAGWRPIPLLALHSRADQVVPVAAIEGFVEALRPRYPDPSAVRLVTWDSTGAPAEHAGFGRMAREARELQLSFLVEHLARVG